MVPKSSYISLSVLTKWCRIPIRICVWFCGNGTAIILQSLISYGIGHINTSIAVWRWFYIIFGLVALFWSVVVWLFMPDTMITANFLNGREKSIAVERIRRNRTGVANPELKKYQIMEALLEIKNWWSFFYTIVWMIPMTAIASFGSLVIKGFGFGAFESSLLNMPLGAVENIGLMAAGYVSLRYKDTRCLMMFVCNIPAVIGAALINYLPATNLTGRLIGFYLTSFSNGTLPMVSVTCYDHATCLITNPGSSGLSKIPTPPAIPSEQLLMP
jgi:hypothetical protein